MKKQFLLLIGVVLILASCSNSDTNIQNEQAKIDSVAKANAALQDIINQKKNDSTINAMATAKADSLEKVNVATKESQGTMKNTSGGSPKATNSISTITDQNKSK